MQPVGAHQRLEGPAPAARAHAAQSAFSPAMAATHLGLLGTGKAHVSRCIVIGQAIQGQITRNMRATHATVQRTQVPILVTQQSQGGIKRTHPIPQ